jgi:SAM-dependent methyltransferase
MADMTTIWTDKSSEGWLRNERIRERQLAIVADELFADARLQPGEAVLDVGCGTGPTTIMAAEQVAPNGRVIGLDVSQLLIDRAISRFAGHPAAERISWLVGNAEHDQGIDPVDVVISRFGVMFFEDPAAAFKQLASTCRPGGRMAIAVWGLFPEAKVFSHPFDLARPVLDDLGVAYEEPRADAGPWSLGEPQSTTELLQTAGWSEASCRLSALELWIGGPGTPESAAEAALTAMPLAGILEQADDHVRDAVRARLIEDFTARHDGTGVPNPGGFMIITASRPDRA